MPQRPSDQHQQGSRPPTPSDTPTIPVITFEQAFPSFLKPKEQLRKEILDDVIVPTLQKIADHLLGKGPLPSRGEALATTVLELQHWLAEGLIDIPDSQWFFYRVGQIIKPNLVEYAIAKRLTPEQRGAILELRASTPAPPASPSSSKPAQVAPPPAEEKPKQGSLF